jgi:hypothetical protein
MYKMAARRTFVLRIALSALVSGLLPAMAAGQNSATPQNPAPPADKTPAAAPATQTDGSTPPAQPLPVDLEHIKREAQRQPAVKLDDQQLRIYVLVLAKAPHFSDIVGDYDLKNGPTRGGAAMTHKEFVDMVTPSELGELFGSTNSQSFALFQAAVMNAAGQALIKKAVEEIRNAHNEREVQAIRDRIDRELAILLNKHP